MGASIDQLQIDINASAVKANTAIDNLVGKLGKLQASLSGLNGNSLTNFANGCKSLGQAMQSMNNVKTTDFTRLAKNLKKLSEVDSASINRAGNSIANITKAFSGLSSMSSTADNFGALAKGIAQLGYKSSTQAIENIPKLAKSMNELMATLSKAPRVSQNLIDMTNALAKLARTGSSGGKAANSLAKNLNTYTMSTSKATKGTFSLASALGKMYATYWMLFRAFGKLGEAINISSDLTEVQNVVDVTFGKYKQLVEDMSNTSITDFGMSELTVKKVSSRFQAMGVAMGFAQGEMSNMSVELTKLAADMASFYNVSQSDVAEDLESIFTGMTRPLRAYGLDLTQATIQEWAHRNGMAANMKTMSQAEKTMLRYQYVLANTGAAQGDFARTSNTWANQVRILKQNFEQLGIVIGGTLIQALKPLVSAMNRAMVSIISFAQTVANALGQIFGWKYEINSGGVANDFETAAGASDDIAGGLGDAEKAAKKLRSYVLGIDELNIIEPDQGTSSGGSGGAGGGGGATGGEGMDLGKLVRTESMFEKFKSEIDSLYKLGDFIGTSLTKTLNKIDWNKVYQGARNFGKGLADFLNGLISPELFGAVGKTIAGALNTAIYASLSFAQTFDFKEFGLSIATGINKFFATFDFKSLAKDINTWAQGIKDTILTALKNIKWKDVFKGIAEFLNELELESVAIIIGMITIKKIATITFAKAVLTGIGTKIATSIGAAIAAGLGTKPVITLISAGFKALFGGKAAQSALVFMFPKASAILGAAKEWVTVTLIPTFAKVGKLIGKAFSGAFGGVITVVTGVFTSIKNFIDMLSDGFDWLKEILMIVGGVIAGIGAVMLGAPALATAIVVAIAELIMTLVVIIKDNWEEIKQWFAGIPSWFDNNVIQPVKVGFENACSLIAEFFSYLWEDIKNIWKDVCDWFNSVVIRPLVDGFKQFKKDASDFFMYLWQDIQNVWKNVCSWFKTTVINPLVEGFKNFKKNVTDFFIYLWQDIQKVWKGVCEWFSSTVITPLVNAFNTAKTNIANFFTQLWEGIKSVWFTVCEWFNTTVIIPLTNLFKSVGNTIKNGFVQAWTTIKEAWGVASAWFSKNVIQPISKAFDTVCDTIGTLFSNVWKSIKSGVVGAMNSVIGAIESAINFMVRGINSVCKGFNSVANWVGDKVGQNWGGVTLVSEVSLGRIKAFENGGFPNAADVFFANENGIPELVGTIGGRTAVASGMEITGISNAVYDTGNHQAILLRQAIGLLQEIADKDMSVKIGDRDIARANQRGQKSMGARLRTS